MRPGTKQAAAGTPPPHPASPPEISASSTRDAGNSIAAAAAATGGDDSRGGGDDVPSNYLAANTGDAGGSGSVPSQLHSSRTASPIHWVGETVEGSLNWLRGGVAASSSNGAVGRRRSRSMGGPLLLGTEGTVSGAGSAATSPGGSIGRGGGNASPASGRRIGFGRAAAEAALGRALPVLGAGIPQGQLARARAWSRTFGSGGQQGLSSPPAVARAGARGGGGLAIDAYDGDGSMDGDGGRGGGGDRGMRAGGDWLVGAGMGDER